MIGTVAARIGKSIKYVLITGYCLAVCSLFVNIRAQQQIVDPDFKVAVENPTYRRHGPTVAIDEAHANFHTKSGQYRPFAELLASDGYNVIASTRRFEKNTLKRIKVLVVANASGGGVGLMAFTDDECDVIQAWVQKGGSLLLIADHRPYGSYAQNLAKRFDVSMGNGWVYDKNPDGKGITPQPLFSRENGLLGEHPITRGRNSSEEVKAVRAFTGQSIGVPTGAAVLMKLSPTAREAVDTDALNAAATAAKNDPPTAPTTIPGTESVAGRAQGIALRYGKGRVVVLGEAAMFSAQVVTLAVGDQQRTFKAGMNVPGNDNRQFALNVLHWLSRLLR